MRRNRIPTLRILRLAKEKYDNEDNDDGRLTLIKSDNPTFEWEAYHYKSGVFLGYMGPRKMDKERKDDTDSNFETLE